MKRKYADLNEKEKLALRNRAAKWRQDYPERAKAFKKISIARSFQPTVYAYFNNGTPIYVGKTTFPKRRLADHRKYSPWWNPNLLLISMTCDNEWHAMEMEGKWGGRYNPTENIDGQRQEKYGYYEDVE